MPLVALKDGSSNVACTDGVKGTACAFDDFGAAIAWNWDADTTQSSDAGSGNVFANRIGVVRKGDVMASHPHGDPCVAAPSNHTPGLDTYSSNVYANNLEIGRIGDHYDGDGTSQTHQISSGSTNVYANGV